MQLLKKQKAVNDKAYAPEIPNYIDLESYIEDGGYEIYRSICDEEISNDAEHSESSELKGLGGAGFPAGRKWRILRDQQAPRLLAINIDEGEPGTFKDRYYLESDPHRFFEGMLIASKVVGIDKIYIYLRDEYPAKIIMEKELDKIKEQFDGIPEIEMRRGAGAYICGEESAMIESIEGKRGMPRLRPPFVAQVGLFGRPTLEHNMETLFWIRDILDKGASWFADQGVNGRKGFLGLLLVSGRVKQPGVHLAPAGITVQELIDDYAGVNDRWS